MIRVFTTVKIVKELTDMLFHVNPSIETITVRLKASLTLVAQRICNQSFVLETQQVDM